MQKQLNDTLYEALLAGAILITPNDRLARTIREDYLKRTNQTVIANPVCLSWSQWVQKLFNINVLNNKKMPLILSPHLISYLWKKILLEQGNTVYEGLISALHETANTCLLWQIDIENPLFENTEQTLFFKKCFQHFQKKLSDLQAITPQQMTSHLLHNMPSITSTVIWCCFDDFTPEQTALQNYLRAQGTQVLFWDFEQPVAHTQIYKAIDEDDELLQIILWTKEQLNAGKQRIGIVIPELETKKRVLTRLLNQHFNPHQYNLSLGQACHEIPLIAHALTWLNLKQNILSRQEAELLLRSPFILGGKGDLHAASAFLNAHILLQDIDIDFPIFIQEIKKTARTLGTALEQLSPYPDKAKPCEWSAYFLQRLNQIGFPGEYSQDSATYQAYQRFLLLFDEFEQLNILVETMSKTEALASFQTLAAHTIFKPQMPPAPIQILGMLEASGCFFDALWLSGLTDECLPKKTKYSAFIPLPLQKSLSLPYTDPAKELKLARQTLQRFLCTSSLLILSYPKLAGERPFRPSPLIAEWFPFAANYHPISILNTWRHQRLHFKDLSLLPLNKPEQFRGTTPLLAHQAQCPFRAFAKYRLNAYRKIQSSDGLSRADRGIIVHRIMELIWQTLISQQNLLCYPEEDLIKLIEHAIDTALEPHQIRTYAFPKLMQTLEKMRLIRLVMPMLEWEKKRMPFTVTEIEKQYTIFLGSMPFYVRIDRKDIAIHLSPAANPEENEIKENHTAWIIDYKSRLPDSTPWFEEKPEEPQILLYALLDDAVQTIVFAELTASSPQFKGLSNLPAFSPGIKTIDMQKQSWDTLRAEWKKRLETLATAFCSGEYAPSPNKPALCATCEFQNLCRVSSHQADDA